MLRKELILLPILLLFLASVVSAGTTDRSISKSTVGLSEEFVVELTVQVNDSEDYFIIDELVPANFTLTYFDPRFSDTDPGHLKYVIVSGATNTTFNYSGFFADPGMYSFVGEYAVNGGDVTSITGDSQVSVADWSLAQQHSYGRVYERAGKTKLVVDSPLGYTEEDGVWSKVDINDFKIHVIGQDRIKFQHKNNHITYETGVYVNDTYYSLKQFDQAHGVTFDIIIEEKSSGVKFTIDIDDIPIDVQPYLKNVTLTLDRVTGFDQGNIKRNKNGEIAVEGVAINFDDLILSGYGVDIDTDNHVVYITGVENQDNLFLDPSLSVDGTSLELYGEHTYDYIEIINGGNITVAAYNGTAGTGSLHLIATDYIYVDPYSSIVGSGRGHHDDDGSGALGSGTDGSGVSCGSGTTYGGGGGGAGYGSTGGTGDSGDGSPGYGGGAGGIEYGNQTNLTAEIGSGGGDGGPACSGGVYNNAGAGGGRGGALIELEANQLNITGVIDASGGDGGSITSAVFGAFRAGAGGGGSGGGIVLTGFGINLTGGTLNVSGGTGGRAGDVSDWCTQDGGEGGGGAGGRVKILYYNPSQLENGSLAIDTSAGIGGFGSGCGAGSGGAGTFWYNQIYYNELSLTQHYPSEGQNINTTNNIAYTWEVEEINTSVSNCSVWSNSSGVWAKVSDNTSAIINNTNNTITEYVDDGTWFWNVVCYIESGVQTEFWGTNTTYNIITTRVADIESIEGFTTKSLVFETDETSVSYYNANNTGTAPMTHCNMSLQSRVGGTSLNAYASFDQSDFTVNGSDSVLVEMTLTGVPVGSYQDWLNLTCAETNDTMNIDATVTADSGDGGTVIIGGGGGGGPRCGDDVCEYPESADTCPADCKGVTFTVDTERLSFEAVPDYTITCLGSFEGCPIVVTNPEDKDLIINIRASERADDSHEWAYFIDEDGTRVEELELRVAAKSEEIFIVGVHVPEDTDLGSYSFQVRMEAEGQLLFISYNVNVVASLGFITSLYQILFSNFLFLPVGIWIILGFVILIVVWGALGARGGPKRR